MREERSIQSQELRETIREIIVEEVKRLLVPEIQAIWKRMDEMQTMFMREINELKRMINEIKRNQCPGCVCRGRLKKVNVQS